MKKKRPPSIPEAEEEFFQWSRRVPSFSSEEAYESAKTYFLWGFDSGVKATKRKTDFAFERKAERIREILDSEE